MKKISETKNKTFNLEKRTTEFGFSVITLVKKIEKNSINNPIINQLVRSGTSIGANYCEANNAQSKKDFMHKIYICKKETRETQYWLTMVTKISPNLKLETEKLWQETKELILIFAKIISSCKNPSFSKLNDSKID